MHCTSSIDGVSWYSELSFEFPTVTHLTLKMTSAQVIETAVTTNSPSQDYIVLSPRRSNSIEICNSWVQIIF